ncbi:translation initiation factor IF-2-like isoform X2 [Passer montanus]|uniref:translation initiation factor IF-2-like isoform X2 n=1 Tax=Passer montanus TaxID=9160 RepID=UPI0019608942|nr:translation initiation factor IF-2-like isoform X2 [Passer montanus]
MRGERRGCGWGDTPATSARPRGSCPERVSLSLRGSSRGREPIACRRGAGRRQPRREGPGAAAAPAPGAQGRLPAGGGGDGGRTEAGKVRARIAGGPVSTRAYGNEATICDERTRLLVLRTSLQL